MTVALLAHPQFKTLSETYRERRSYYDYIETKIRETRDDPDQSQARADLEQKKPAARGHGACTRSLAHLVKVDNPHV